MKLLLLGADGQVGWELQRSLQPLGQIVRYSRKTNPKIDFTSPDSVAELVLDEKPDIIVNAAAYTAVDLAETDVHTANLVNHLTPGSIAKATERLNGFLVHYSTDYVFDGTGGHFRNEESPTNPLSVYGRTKLAGEMSIAESGCRHLVFRTSWVYAQRGKNFIRTVLDLAKHREELRVISDQTGAPTGAELIADVTAHAIAQIRSGHSANGVYNLVASGVTTWFELAEFAIWEARQRGWSFTLNKLEPISSADYAQKAHRPLNSRLSTERISHDFGLCMPAWEAGVTRLLDEWCRS